MLTVAFGLSTMRRMQVQSWYNRFKKGPEDVNAVAHLGRSSTSTAVENVEAGKSIILNNRRITFKEIVDDIDTSFGSW